MGVILMRGDRPAIGDYVYSCCRFSNLPYPSTSLSLTSIFPLLLSPFPCFHRIKQMIRLRVIRAFVSPFDDGGAEQ